MPPSRVYAEIFGDDYYLAIVVNNINNMIDTTIMSEFHPWRKARDVKPYLCPPHVFVKYIFSKKTGARWESNPLRCICTALPFGHRAPRMSVFFNAANYLFYACLEQCYALAIVAAECSCYV